MYRTAQPATTIVVVFLLFALLLPAAFSPAALPEVVRIGVLVNRNREDIIKRWTPTAEYLTGQVPGYTFIIVPLDFQQIVPAVDRGEVDFVLANSSIYVELEFRFGTTRIATLKDLGFKGSRSSFGGVVFCRANRNDIRELGDLRGKSFAAVDETSLGGWQVAWRELRTAGIDPFHDFSALAFLHSHDAVVLAIRDGRFDAGTVRTDTLERLTAAGQIDVADFRVLNPRRQDDFPFALSTRLYPEWPFAKVNGTPEALATKVAVSLLNMPPDSPAAQAANIAGWTSPLVYQPVHDLMKELRIGPYRNYGKITLGAAIRLYWYWVALTALVLVAMAVSTGHVMQLNRLLKQSRKELEASRNSLEMQVQERTADLAKRNEDLRHEVSQRRQAELDSRRARGEWELTFNSISDLIAIIDIDNRIMRVNHSLAAKLGKSPEALVGELCHIQLCGAEEMPAHCPHRQTLADGREHAAQMHLAHLGGDFIVTTSPLSTGAISMSGVVHVCHDISAAVSAEREREAAYKFLQAVIDGVTEAIMVIAPDHRVVLMNHPAREFSIPDTYCYRVSHEREEPCSGEHPCPLQAVLATKKPVLVTHTHRHRSGSPFQVEILASPIFDDRGEVAYVVEACRDVTEKLALAELQKKMQEQLFREQKEQSIATLAGGIAHDFNNMLMGVLGNAELLAMLAPVPEEQRRSIDTIIELTKRMAHLTNQLLAYSRQGAYEHTMLSLNDVIRETFALTHKESTSAIEVRMDCQGDLWPVSADPSQMSQLLVGLLRNAFEAMQSGGGTLEVLTENITGKAAWECSHEQHRGGDYVHLRVRDTGHGIPEDIQHRIFEPFFTTKFMGRGLGLAAAQGVVRNHGGCISFESTPGRGTAFDVYLPRHDATAQALALERQPQGRPEKKILVVEDEAAVLAVLQALLARLGFEPIPATSAAQALALFTPQRHNIPLAILDVQMEAMDGRQLARELKTINPDIKVLISSGYDEQTALSGLERRHYDGFIHKPYWLDELRAKLLSLLGT